MRVRCYRDALNQLVSTSSVVLDLGSGTGILGALAASAGAATVYSVDRTSVAAVAVDVARHNNLDQIDVIVGDSLDIELSRPVDLVVCDQMGPLGFEAGLFESLADAAERHLAPGGVLMPRTLRLSWAPACAAEIEQSLVPWRNGVAGIDLSPALEWATNTEYGCRLRPTDLLGEAVDAVPVELGTVPDELDLSGRSTISHAGTVDALAGWFTAELAPGIEITNSPVAAEPIDRDLAALPLMVPIEVTPGDIVHATIRIRPSTRQILWKVDVDHVDGRSSRGELQSTSRAALVSRRDLERRRDDHRPELTPRGEAQRFVLDLCDGSHTVASIIEAVRLRFPDVAPDGPSATHFVHDVLGDVQR